ncbi:MAG: hypothetical protein HFF85_11055, partial [Oscillibacter sp.]|nr:hypothetical protein [Oscillibacter sp.]
NPDSDEFRRVYLVVITGVAAYTGPTDPVDPQPTDGAVKFADGYNTDGKLGTIKNSSVTILGSGSTTVSFTLAKPAWAAAASSSPATTSVDFDYEVYVDGERWAVGSAMTASNFTVNSDNTEWTIKDKAITTTDLSNDEAKGHKVEIVITNVDWKNAVVEYQLNGKAVEVDETSTTMTMPTSGSTGAQIKFAVKGVATAAGTYTVSGIQAKDNSGTDLTTADYTNVTTGDITNQAAGGKYFLAKGGEKVIVDIAASNVTELYDVTIGGKAITAGTPTNIRIQDNNLLDAADRPLDYDDLDLGSIAVMKKDDGVAGATSVAKGTPVTFLVGATAADAGYEGNAIKGFKVYATLTNGTTTEEVIVDTTNLSFNGTTNGNEGTVRVVAEGPVDLTINRVEIIGMVAIGAGKTDAKTVVFTFNEAITAVDTSKVKSNDANATKISAVSEGNTLKVTVDNTAAWTTGSKITLEAAAVTGADGTNDEIVFTIS